MKTIYLIHGWKGSPDNAFFPQLKKELIKKGNKVIVPNLPNSDFPTVLGWVSFLQKLISKPNLETIIVGHSLGGLAVLKFLEALPKGMIVGKIVLVSPVINKVLKIPDGAKELVDEWFGKPLDTEKIKNSVIKIVGFFSDDDPLVPLETEKLFKNWFGAITFIEHNKKHYNDRGKQLDVSSILKEI